MKVGIYGDSYGVTRELETSWPSQLGKKLDCVIDNYSVGGSSVYYSFLKFMQTHEQYDVIIFLVTDPLRYPVEIDFSDKIHRSNRNLGGLVAAEYIKMAMQDSLTALDRQLLSNVEGWYKASNIEYMHTVNELFLDKIVDTHPNVILYPCFKASLPDKYFTLDVNYIMISLYLKQLKMLGVSTDLESLKNIGLQENPDIISGHLVPELNAAMAEFMFTKIKTGIWDYSIFDKVETLIYPKEYYYLG